MKAVVMVVAVMAAVAMAAPQGIDQLLGGQQVGANLEQSFPPRPYTFQFNIADEVEGVRFAQVGQGDEQGNMQGSYSYVRPDGVLVTVTYIADKNGFHPEIIEEPAPQFEKNPLGTSKHSVLLPFAEEFVIEVTGDQLKGYREQAAAKQAQQIQLGQQRPN